MIMVITKSCGLLSFRNKYSGMSSQLKQFDPCTCSFASFQFCKGICSEAETLNKYHIFMLGNHYINDSDGHEKLQYVKFQR